MVLTRKNRTIMIIILTIVMIMTFVYYLFPELSLLYIRYISVPKSTDPEPYMIPMYRQIETSPLGTDRQIIVNYKGLVFKTPWGPLIKSKEVSKVNTCQYWFAQDRWLWVNTTGALAYYYYKDLEKGNTDLKPVVGNRRTAYGLLEKILNVTPDNIQFFQNRTKMSILLSELMLKIEMLPRCNRIYHLETPEVDVLEYFIEKTGDKPARAMLELSDTEGNFYSVYVVSPTLSQDEIEEIVSSMRIKR